MEMPNPGMLQGSEACVGTKKRCLKANFFPEAVHYGCQRPSWSNLLGEGGFGPVYKGFIDDKLRPGLEAQPVAVKLLDLDGLQGHREWLVSFLFNFF